MTCQLPLACVQERCGGIVERGVERHLGLHARDAIHREPVLALEILDQRHQRGVEAIVAGLLRRAGR